MKNTTFKHFLIILVLSCLAAKPVFAGTAVPGENLFHQVSSFELTNQLNTYHAHLEEAKFFKFTIYVWAGGVDEDEKRTSGVAHFLEHMLFHGEDFGEVEFENRVKELGGSYNALTYLPFTRFYIYLPKQHLLEGLELLWKVVFNDQLRADRVVDVKQVIDRENGWSDPTWFDRMQFIFNRPSYLHEPGFWQNQFGLSEYDRSAGGVEKVARQLTLESADEFRKRHYRVPNMTAIYVGPHSPRIVRKELNRLAQLRPGAVSGELNRRASLKLPLSAVKAYRNFEFNDQDPSMTLGFLFSQLQFEDSPHLTLYTELLKRFLYENVRYESAQTYSVRSTVETYRGSGYLTFNSQASRLSFDRIQRFVSDVIWNRDFRLIGKERFEQSKTDYVNYVKSRLHRPDFMDAYLGFLIRAHDDHRPTVEQLNWIKSLSGVSYDSLREWRLSKLKHAPRYEYLEAPSAFIPYEILPLLLIVGFLTIFFWKRLLLNPEDIRFVQLSVTFSSIPFGFIYPFAIYYGAYFFLVHFFYVFNRGLEVALQSGLPLYFSGYLHGAVSCVVLVSMIVVAGAAIPRRLLITRDRMTIKSAIFASRSFPLSTVTGVEKVGPGAIFRMPARPLNLFFKSGILIRFKDRKPMMFGVRDIHACAQLLSIAIQSDGKDFRQLSFPGMHPNHIQGTSIE